MKTFLFALSMVATLIQPISILNTNYSGIGDYNNPNFFDFGYDLKYITDHFLVGVDNALDTISDFIDDAFPSVTVKDINYKSPSVKYYDKSDHSTTNNFSYDIYNSFDLNYDNRSYAMFYNYNINNRTYTYTYNTVNNNYESYDYRTYNSYVTYDDDEYLYVTNNNITNYEVLAISKIDPNDNRYYSYYYQLPSGSSSFNLTKEQVLGEFMSYDIYQYDYISDSDDILGLWHFDGNYRNEVDNGISITYDGSDFVNAHFDGGIKLDGYYDMHLNGTLPSQYTLEFWFYNNINNGTYTGCGAPNSWVHCAYTYDNGDVRVWFNGVESTRAKHESLSCAMTIQSPRIIQVANTDPNTTFGVPGYDYTQSNRLSEVTSFRSLYDVNSALSDKLPSVTCGVNGDLSITYNGETIINQSVYENNTFRVGTLTTVGSDTNTYLYNNGSKDEYIIYTGVDENDPLHYYPQFTQNSVEFGFSGSSHEVESKSFDGRLLHSSKDGWSSFTGSNSSVSFLRTNNFVLSPSPYGYMNDYTRNAGAWDVVAGIGTVGDIYANDNYVDMSECIIDEMRLTSGLLYTSTQFQYPLDKFSYGHIFVRPYGDDFNVGDVAIQTTIPITDYRIGGADYSYPHRGNVYIGLDSSVGVYSKVYDGRSWIICDFGVWNGNSWSDGVGFNFSLLTWGNKDTNINIDINIDQDINVTDDDKESFRDLISTIGEWLGIIPLCIAFCTFIPTPITIIFGGILGLIAILIVVKLIKG